MDTSEPSNSSNNPLDDELAPPADPSTPSVDDDIPTAKRESASPTAKRSIGWPLMIGGLGAIAIGGLAIFGFQSITASNGTPDPDMATSGDRSDDTTDTTASGTSSDPAQENNVDSGSGSTTETPNPSATEDTILGHKAYDEASQADLVPLRSNGGVLVHQAAAEKLDQMIAAANVDGVNLMVISGFRTFEDQRYLFFDVKAERGQTSQDRAEVSAPPGYSEHHTGYAVDFADGYYPDTDLQIDFEDTPAFRWLEDNAAYYGFELSFPRDNEQGISYEPWHWRFVGDPDSLETFYKETVPAESSGNPPGSTAPERQSAPSEDSEADQANDDDRADRGTNQALIHFGDRNSQSN
ncbi:MAG: M15 family metallopeptidase [Thainema sp.]